MSFLSQFDCDVFVSYATANNQSFAQDKPGWVTSFRDILKTMLDEGLERRGASEVWMDYKLRGNELFDEQLRKKVSKAAIFLIVLSDAYLKSDACQRELQIFMDAVQGERGRIFLIHYEPVAFDRWPEALNGLSAEKYRFFQQERDGAICKPLGFPIPNPENPAHYSFYDRLLELRLDLAAKLEGMAGSGQPAIVPSLSQANATAPAVFLSEACGDTLYDRRQLVKSHLEQSGLRVLPTKSYWRTPTPEMDRELSESLLFVQMLGRFGGGYETLHYERAVAAGLPVLRWRSRDLDIGTVGDPGHRELLDSPDVQAMDVDELKRSIVDRVRVLSAKRPSAPIEGEHFVLVNAAATDMQVADAVVEQLEQWNVGYDLVDDTVSLRDVAESTAYDALLVIYGGCPHDWVRQQLIKCREILLTKKSRAPSCAVYVGPPNEKQPLRCRPPRVAVIDTQDQAQLRAFIEKLSTQELTA
ncbi:MAG: toll/interleukin-1 receptor domain-containing protein [Candidatus Paceibacterota bacterium]